LLICDNNFVILDYLLSNNHINSIIVHKFDFSDEEVCRCCSLYFVFVDMISDHFDAACGVNSDIK